MPYDSSIFPITAMTSHMTKEDNDALRHGFIRDARDSLMTRHGAGVSFGEADDAALARARGVTRISVAP